MNKMQFVLNTLDIEADLLIVMDQPFQKMLDRKLNCAIELNLKNHPFPNEPMLMTTNGAYSVPRISIIPSCQDVKGAATQIATLARHGTVACSIDERVKNEILFEVLLLNPECEKLLVLSDDPAVCVDHFEKFTQLASAIKNAKELISAPANLMPPSRFAEKILPLQNQGVSLEILGSRRLEEIGFHALLAVGKGSTNPPRAAVMHWKGAEGPPVVLVGKGVCFDAGGIHLKTTHLNEMKWDKAGAGVVVGVLDAVSKWNLPVNVVGIVGLAENMPSGSAMKPGDVISTLAGKKIEIVDTDCEGRLILADCLTYAQQNYNPKVLIDLGTLTLETFGALGKEYAGLFCNDQNLKSALMTAGETSCEKLWHLPLGSYYADQLKSPIADLKNAGVYRYGGSSAAAEFLRAFVHPGIPWAHLDISGVAWDIEKPTDGVSGWGIRLLVEYLSSFGK